MSSLTTAQEEAKSSEPAAKPSHHGRQVNRAEEHVGYRATGHRRVIATHTIPQEFTDMTNAQQTTPPTAENRASDKEASVNETRVTG